MKVQYFTASSINGYIADAQHSLAWLFQCKQPKELESLFLRFIAEIGALAMGANTYTWILEQEDLLTHPERWPYQIPAWIFTHRNLPPVPGANLYWAQGDIRAVYTDMVQAAEGKNLWIVGGGELAGQFYDQELLDEIVLSIAPVMLAAGVPLLPRNLTYPVLKLKQIESYEDFVILTYTLQKNSQANY